MTIYDISLKISEKMITWPGDPSVKIERTALIANGNTCNVSRINMATHTGTHIDAPYHFLENGNTIEKINLESLMGTCIVLEIDVDNNIKAEDIKKHNISGHSRVIFKTKNSELWESNSDNFNKDFISLSQDAAEYLVEKSVELIGIDYLSIESFYCDKKHAVHKILLKNNVIIVEGLNLSSVEPGIYELICLPLKLDGTDGAPARVVLRDI